MCASFHNSMRSDIYHFNFTSQGLCRSRTYLRIGRPNDFGLNGQTNEMCFFSINFGIAQSFTCLPSLWNSFHTNLTGKLPLQEERCIFYPFRVYKMLQHGLHHWKDFGLYASKYGLHGATERRLGYVFANKLLGAVLVLRNLHHLV